MKSKPVKWISPAITAITSLLVLAVVGVGLWLYTGPREAGFLTPHIEEALMSPGSGYRATVRETVIGWGGFATPLTVTLRDVRLVKDAGDGYISLPEISVGIKLSKLLLGQIKLTDLVLHKPELWVMRSEGGGMHLGMGDEEQGESLFDYFISDLSKLDDFTEKTGFSLELLSIEDATLILGDQNTGVYQKVPGTDVRIQTTAKGMSGAIHAPITFGDVVTDTLLDFHLDKGNRTAEAKLNFDNLQLPLWAQIFPQLVQLKDISLPLKGEVTLDAGFDGKISSVAFHVTGGEGTITVADHFPEPFQVSSLDTSGAIVDDLRTLRIDGFVADFHGPVLRTTGSISQKEQSIALDIDANAENLPVEELYRYWPTTLGPKVREWVTTRITKGVVPKAHAKLTLDTADIVDHHIPEDSLEADIDVQGARVDYYGTLTPVEDVSGTVHFTGKAMDINATAGRMYQQAKLKSGRVQISDMTTHTPEIAIDLDIAAPGNEVASYLSNDLFHFSKLLNLEPDSTTGNAEGKVKLRFNLNHEVLHSEGVSYDVKGTVKQASTPAFMGSMDIKQGDFALSIGRDKAIDLEGTAVINQLPLAINWHTDLSKQEKYEQSYRIKAAGTTDQFTGFGLQKIDGLAGNITLDATVQQTGGTRYIEATADLTQTTMDFPRLSYSKAAGEQGALLVKGTASSDNSFNIQQFALTATGLDTAGAALIATKPFAFEMLKLDRLRMGGQDISLRLLEGGRNGYDVNISGDTLDLTRMMENTDSGGTMPDMDITLDVDELVLGEHKHLPNVKGTLTCTKNKCHDVDISLTFDNGKKVLYKIKPDKSNTRALSITTDDAGTLAAALNITDKMRGGTLDLNATILDDAPKRNVRGRASINGFRLSKAPVLAKILALSSLSGIEALLNGDKGVDFDKMTIPFILEDNVVMFKDAQATGSSLGVKASGAVNIDTTKLDIAGTVVPSNAINTLVGKVPLVGETIVGGEGEGLFAATFKVEGTYEDAKVSTNPLSMLTPGLLRDVFGEKIGDVKGQKEPAPESPQDATTGVQ